MCYTNYSDLGHKRVGNPTELLVGNGCDDERILSHFSLTNTGDRVGERLVEISKQAITIANQDTILKGIVIDAPVEKNP